MTVLLLVACVCASCVTAGVGVDAQSGVASSSERVEADGRHTAVDGTATQGAGVRNESEPNDDLQNANALRPDSPVAGTVSSASDIDVYALNLEEGETVRANLSRLTGSGLLAVGVYGPSGFVSSTVAEPGQTTRYAEQANQSGQYFVIVAPASRFGVEAPNASGTGLYVLQATRKSTPQPTPPGTTTGRTTAPQTATQTTTTQTQTTEEPTTQAETPSPTRTTVPAETTTAGGTNVESEPNDEFTRPDSLAVGESVRGAISSTTDRDVYAVQLDAGESITVDLARSGGTGRFVYGAFHPNGAVIAAGGVNPGETTTVTVEANQSGTYLLPVIASPDEPGTGRYRLSVAQTRVGGPFGQQVASESNGTTFAVSRPATPGHWVRSL
ncbi:MULTISPECIES: hypothetical protein [Halorussus]|uniref:hypothetical protein n=1 Tax=Halorussus TaxID=1070314 RepID=UPI00209D6852|nr:hypothetical protein [Halorussus vallis]USZ78057.1 hypothetical protein NGM07_20555 [Halorussus vallis]